MRLSVTALAVGVAAGMALFVAEPLTVRAEPSMSAQSPGSGRGGARGDEASQARARAELAIKQLQAKVATVRDEARSAVLAQGGAHSQGAAGPQGGAALKVQGVHALQGAAAPWDGASSVASRVIADPSAPGSQRPTVLTAPNGATLVNIQTPSVAGVSRNTYSQFDVGATGVILNNSRTDTSTQLGGWVQGNPWLGRGEAQVILNEVNSSAPSQLHGYVEVAGRRAEVVIANPSGIQVDGGGFINASSATLTTGTPRFDAAGHISGFAVQGGLIRIDGAGLDARSTDYTSLLARAVELNAGLWAKDVRVQTGTQVMSAQTAGAGEGAGEALAAHGERPRYALDSTALGGIYAQQITLVGTEAGLGVRQAGQIVGSRLTLRADGWLDNTGAVYAQRSDAEASLPTDGDASGVRSGERPPLVMTSAQGVRNAGQIASWGSAELRAPQLQSLSGSLTAAGVGADGQIAAGAVESTASLVLTASQSQSQAGQLLASQRVQVQAPVVDLGGAQAKANVIAVSGNQVDARGATLVASENVAVTATGAADVSRAQTEAPGILIAGASVTADGSQLNAGQTLQVQAMGRLSAIQATWMADALKLSAGQADLSGGEFLQTGTQTLKLGFDSALTADGARIATNASDLTLTAESIRAREARLEHYGAGTLALTTSGLDLSGTQVLSGGRFELAATQATLDRSQVAAQAVDWQTGQLSHRGAHTQMAGAEASRIVTQSVLDNRSARIESNSTLLSLQASAIENGGGVVSSVGDLHVDADRLGNQAGWLLSNQRLIVGSSQRPALVDNMSGQVGAAELALYAGQVLNAGGTVLAAHDAVLDVGQWQHGEGRLEAGTLTVNAARWEGGGTVYARDDATLKAGTLQTSGLLAAGQSLTVRADQLSTSGLVAAGLLADGTLATATEGQSGATSQIDRPQAADGRLTLLADSLNNTGALQSSGSTQIAVSHAFSNGGLLYAQGAAAVSAAQVINPGTLASQGDLSVAALQISGSGGLASGLRRDNTLAQQGRLTVSAIEQLQFSGAMTAASELSASAAAMQLQGAQLQARTVSLRASAGDLSLERAALAASDLSMSAQQDLITSRAQIGAGQVQLTARDWINTGGRLTQTSADGALASSLSRDLNNQGGTIESAGRQLTLGAAAVNNTGGRIAQAGGALQLQAATWNGAQGRVLASGALDWTVARDLALTGASTQADSIQIRSDSLTHDGAQMASAHATHLALMGALNNQGGTLAAGTSLTVEAGRVTNAAGGVMQAGNALWIHTTGLTAAASAIATAVSAEPIHPGGSPDSGERNTSTAPGKVDGLDNQGGRLRSGGDMRLDTATLDNRGGWVGSDGALTIQSARAVRNSQGSLLAQQAVAVTSGTLENQTGRLVSGRDGVSVTTSGLLDNTGGAVLASSGIALTSAGLINDRGELSGTTVLLDTLGQSFSNRAGKVLSGENLTLRSGTLDNFGGLLQSGQTLSINTGGEALINTVDASISTPTGLRSQGAMLIDAGSVENSAGIGGTAVTLNATSLTNRQTVSGQTLALSISGALDNQGGQLVGVQSIAATGRDVLNEGGLIYGGESLNVRTAGLLDNRSTAGASQGLQGGAITLHAANLGNRNGQVRANADLLVTATQSLDNSSGVLSGLGQTVVTGADPLMLRGSDPMAQLGSYPSLQINRSAESLPTSSAAKPVSAPGAASGANPVSSDASALATQPVGRASGLILSNQSGTVWGGKAVSVNAASLSGGGMFSSGGSLALTLGGDLIYGTGTLLQARGDLSLALTGSFVNEGILRAGGSLDIQAQSIDNRAAGELSSADTRLTATDTLTNRGLIDGDRVRVNAAAITNLGTGRIYGSDLTLSGGQLTNGAESGQSAVIASRGALTLALTGGVTNTDQALIFSDGDLRLTAASVVNQNATVEATRSLQMDVGGAITNRSVHDGADSLPQDPNAPRVLVSKAFISSGGDMRLSTGQLINSGATVEARGNLLLQSADIQNLNPYLQWQKVSGPTTTGWEFQAPGSTVRYTPDQIRVLWEVTYNGSTWFSQWGSDAQASLEPFVWEFHPKTSNWSKDTYNRKMLLPSQRYPNEVFGRYLGGFGGDVRGSAMRGFEWHPSADHDREVCDKDDSCKIILVPGAHYPASDRIWSDFGVTPGDDNALDAAVAAFFADANSRLVGDFTAFNYSRTTESAKVTQSAAGQIIVGGTLSVQGGRIVNEMSRIIGRDGVQIQSDSIDNRSTDVAVSGTEHVDVYRTYNGGSGVPNTHYEYSTTDAAINGTVKLTLPVVGVGGAVLGTAPEGRQQAGVVGGGSGAQVQSIVSAGSLNASDRGGLGSLSEVLDQSVGRGGDVTAKRATAAIRAASGGLAAALRSAASVQGFDASGKLRAVPLSLSLPTSSLFKLRTDTSSGYLVETDPRYANYRNWLSSDYLLQALAVDPATVQKRLGDGFYEQRLVREQIGQLTGSTFLQGYSSDEEMYRALLTNGASFAAAHELRPGVALTAEQMSQLTTDLVWLVEQSVTLADGSTQRVLVPQVYLLPRDGDLQASGALIAGSRVDLALSGALNNSGDLQASEGLRATAQNIVNSGSMRGAQLALSAADDLRNIGGSLTATDAMSLKAGRDLIVTTTTASSTTATSQRTVLDRVASLTAGGVMLLQAGQDVVLEAARIRQTGMDAGTGAVAGNGTATNAGAGISPSGVFVQAGRDLKLTTVQTASSDRATFDANNHLYQGNSQQVGTSLDAKGTVLLSAGQDLTAHGASVNSAGAMQLNAARDVQLLAAQSTESLDEASKHTVKGFLKSTTTTSKTQLERTTATGTTISGDTVAITAGQDIRVQGSNVVSDAATAVQAGRDVKLENALDTSQRQQERQVVTKGLTGAGAGFSIGTRDQRTGQSGNSQTVVGSTVGSVGGDVSIVAGRDYSQVGSIVQTPKGDVDVTAQRISISAATQQGKDVQTTSFRQSGLSVSVSSPLVSALESTVDMADNIGKVSDARMQALGAASTAIKAKEAVQALQADPKAAGGLSISVTLGSSQSKSRTETTTTTHQGSEITAGGDIRLTAQGAGKESTITVQGSDLSAAQRLALKAEGDVSLTAVQDTVKQQSSNSSSSASVGAAIGVGSSGATIGFTASASLARGRSDGEDVIQRNTHLQGQQVSIESGGDTTLKGAVVSGERVKATVGGNLRIESLQDTSKFKSDSTQVGGSMTAGAGISGSVSGGQSKIRSDFASVTEQSSIRAGDGGFQVDVKGNTDLKGGAITSTQAAVDSGANSFKSGSLTLSDIENKANYQGSSFNVSAGFGKKEDGNKKEGEAPKPTDGSYQLTVVKPGGAPGSSAGFGYSSDSASSVTQAGISGVAGNAAARTGDAETGIKQIFDKEKVQQDLAAQVAITQTFGKEASQQIGDFAQKQMNLAQALQTKAEGETDPVKKAELEKQAAAIERDWGDYGVLRLAAHTVVGGLTGNASGAVGAAAGTLTAPAVADALKNAGVEGDLAKGLTALASTAVGAAAGGGAAGGVTAYNEVTNNYLNHAQLMQRRAELAACKTSACEDAVRQRWIEISKAANMAALEACVNGTTADCRAELKQLGADLAELLSNPDSKGQKKFVSETSNNLKQVEEKIRTGLEILAYRANEQLGALYASPDELAKARLLTAEEAAELKRRRLSTMVDVLGAVSLPDSKAPRKPIKETAGSAETRPGTANAAVHAEAPPSGELSAKAPVQEPVVKKLPQEPVVKSLPQDSASNSVKPIQTDVEALRPMKVDTTELPSISKVMEPSGTAGVPSEMGSTTNPAGVHQEPGGAPAASVKAEQSLEPVRTDAPDKSSTSSSTKGPGADSDAGPQATTNKATAEEGVGCANPPQCFVAGTLIHTVDGPKAIETFVGGELVLSRHEHTGEAGVRPVVATVATKDQPIYEVVIENAQGETETLHTTAEHPFWVINAADERGEYFSEVFESQWVRAASLMPGMRLVDWLGSELIVLRQGAAGWNADVFNLEVREHHTYHVGTLRVWAHNAPCCKVGNAERSVEDFIADVHGALETKINSAELAEFRVLDPTAKIGLTGSSATGRVGNPNKETFGKPINMNEFDLDLFVQSDLLLDQLGGKLRAVPILRQELVNDFPILFKGLKSGKKGLSIKFRPHGEPPKGSIIFGD
ncbi:hypothetical protein RD2015_4512 [Roseateles depolymerans]|uniref:Filamentous haemagglutinin FhaB/tRNA nuclease CdiA-like TPS domain-containing protein n=5 Tax=Roseateles depolymerans TaxID=76731 RepID=A0A0U3MKF8_9BURK|nr:hypothetical protein RD2015_4512 [Roseateles depolymerans]